MLFFQNPLPFRQPFLKQELYGKKNTLNYGGVLNYTGKGMLQSQFVYFLCGESQLVL